MVKFLQGDKIFKWWKEVFTTNGAETTEYLHAIN